MKRIVKISEYPYRLRKTLKLAASWINKNQNNIKIQLVNEKLGDFDYPDYWDLPKSISNKLSSEEVDFIQEQVNEFYFTNVRDCY